jgi:maleate cis-trans isomerase
VALTPRRLGLLTPFQELPGEVEDVVASAHETAALWQVIAEMPVDSHEVEALREAGSDRVLLAAVERMRRWRPDVITWACTSGSFVYGRAGAGAQVATLEAAGGVPATSTSLAFVEALSALAIDRVSVIASYPEPLTAAFEAFLVEWGITVETSVALGCSGASTAQLLTAADVQAHVADVGPGIPILVPDTAVWGLEIHRHMAEQLAVPLLVANQVTLWHTFELAGMSTDLAAFGALRGLSAPGITRPASVGGGS